MFQLSDSKDGFRNNNELIRNSETIVSTISAINITNIDMKLITAAVKIQNTESKTKVR